MGQLKRARKHRINSPHESWRLAQAVTLSARLIKDHFRAAYDHDWSMYDAFMAAAGNVAGPQTDKVVKK